MKSIKLVLLIFIILSLNIDAAISDQDYVNKHIVILYDFSGSVLEQPNEIKRANQYLIHLICTDSLREENRLSEHDLIANRLKAFKISEPLYQPGDVVTFLTFGINSDGIATVTAASTTHSVFIDNFARELIKNLGSYPNSDHTNVNEFINEHCPRSNTKKNNYTFSRYVASLALKVIPEYYPQHTILIMVSDFKSGTDEASLADQLLVRKFFPHYLSAIKRYEENFKTIFEASELLTLSIGTTRAIVIKAVKISPILAPKFTCNFDQKPVLAKKGADEYRLPKTKFKLENMNNFRVDERYVLLYLPKSKSSKLYPTVFTRGSLNEGEITVADLCIPRIDIPRSENTAFLKLKLEGGFNRENAPLSASIESEGVTIPIHHAPTTKWGRIFLIIFGCLAIAGFSTWGLAFRKPKIVPRIAKNFERLNDKEEDIIIEWACRICRIPIALKNNSDVLNLKYPSPVISVDRPNIPEKYLEILNPSLVSEHNDEYKARNFGEEIVFEKLGPKTEKAVYLVLDLRKFPEPQDKTEPMTFRLNYKPDKNGDYVPQLEYKIIIRRSLGPFWLGIDPGTSASCIAGGDQLNNIELVKFYDTFVIPSLVYIRNDYKFPEGSSSITRYSDGIVCGKEAQVVMRANRERTFYSAKKLIGYNVSRNIRLNGNEIPVSGQDIVKVLNDYLIKEAKKFFIIQNKGVLINKAAVAVPNNFTPLKINKMVEAVKSSTGIEKVYHVYEAEAVTLYYLSNYETFNKERSEKMLKGLRENVIVFDFGGGTINVSIIGLTRPQSDSDKVKLEILARVGYAIGGETFDRIIAEIIWNKLGEATQFLPKPFAKPDEIAKFSNEEHSLWWLISLNLKDMAEQCKIKLSDQNRLTKERYREKYNEDIFSKITFLPKKIISFDYLSKQLQDIVSKVLEENSITIELADVLNNSEIKNVLLRLQECVESAATIYFEKNLEPIHTVIFSGRSSFFPTVREIIKEKILDKNKGQRPYYIDSMDENEVKLAVAYGTAYYAAEQQNIILSKLKTLANYGYLVVNPTQQQADTFRNVIPINSLFDEKSDNAIGIDKKQTIKNNNKRIKFYQVNSEKAKAQDIINNEEKEKYSQVAVVDVSSDFIQQLEISINSKDKFEGLVNDGKGDVPITADVEINDILEDTDEKYTWLLDNKGA